MSLIELLNVNPCGLQPQDRIYGVVTGIVVDNKDSKGRVKVNFPWLAEEVDAVAMTSKKEEDRAHSYWARVATPMAGPDRGIWIIPEVNEEVLVAFEHGVLDRPYVVGVLWNAKDKPPEQMDGDGENNIRAIHSRSGHKVVLNDSKDEPSILVVDKTGNNSILIDSANNAMEIKVKGDLSIDVGGDIKIKANGKLTIETGQDIEAKPKKNLKVIAGIKTDLEAATISLNGKTMTEINGGLVKIN